MVHGRIPLRHRRYGWCTGSYLLRAFGITTGRIGRLTGPNVRRAFASDRFRFLVEITWRRKGGSSRRESVSVMSTCCGTGPPGTVILGSPAKTYSALARSVPSVRLLGDRSTWPAQRQAPGRDMDRGFTHPPNRQSEVIRCHKYPFSERVLGPMITQRTRSSHLGKRCC